MPMPNDPSKHDAYRKKMSHKGILNGNYGKPSKKIVVVTQTHPDCLYHYVQHAIDTRMVKDRTGNNTLLI
jgi:hypothetical protein